MFLPHACLYAIALLSLIETCAVARSTSFLPLASAVWGSTSTSPSLAPTFGPSNSKERRHSKRRRRVSSRTRETKVKYKNRDNHEPKKRTKRRKRKALPRATQDRSRYFSHELVGSAARSSASADRKGTRSTSRTHGKMTKRRRSSTIIEAKKSTQPRLRKSKKRIRRQSSKMVQTTVAPSEKRSVDSDLASRKRRSSKRRKHVAADSQPIPKSIPTKGSYKKKQQVKRTKKRRLVSTKHTRDGAEPEEVEEPTRKSLQFLTKDKIDCETSPTTDNSKDDSHVITNDEDMVETNDKSVPTNSHSIQHEKKEEETSIELEGVSNVAANESDDQVAASASKRGPTTSAQEAGSCSEVSSSPILDSMPIAEVESAVNDIDRAVELQGLTEMTASTNFENEEAGNGEETEQQKGDNEESDKVDASATNLDENESFSDELSVQAAGVESELMWQGEAVIQAQHPLGESCPEASIDEGKTQVLEASESIVEDNAIDLEKKEGSLAKEEDGVVDFIEDILQEDVKSWVNDPSSDESGSKSTLALNDTRGGHQNANTSTNDEVKNNETKPAEGKDLSHAATEKENRTVTLKDTTTETVSLDPSLLQSHEDCETDIAVSVVTWNLAEISPAEEDAAFIRKFRKSGTKKGSGSDLVLISGQECENIKPRRSEGSRSREYRRLMIKMLGKQYVPIALHLLGGIQLGLFAKKSFLKEIEEISIADVTCGIGNVFHNKGAIAAFLKVKARNPSSKTNKAKSLRMVFVTAHMAAHVKNVEARNADFWRISSELEAQAPEGFLPDQHISIDSEHESFLFNSADRVFFCGDLNYRVDLPRELTEFQTLEEGHNDDKKELYSELMYHDQLKATMCENQAFPGFAEGRIAFAPTFKFDKETDSYDTSHKQRIPAWTDRILFKPFGTRVLEYTSVPDAQHSDHRPVYGTFRVSMEGKDLPSKKSRTRKLRERRRQSDRD